EVGGTKLTRLEPDTDQTLVEGVQQIRTPPEVEHPDQDDSRPAPEPRQREQGQDSGNEITVGRRARVRARQVRRYDAGHQECQADEPETVQEEERPQGTDPRVVAQHLPEGSRAGEPPGQQAEGATDPEPSKGSDARLQAPVAIVP